MGLYAVANAPKGECKFEQADTSFDKSEVSPSFRAANVGTLLTGT